MTIFDRNRPSLEAGTTEAVPRQSHAREEKIDARFLTRLQQTIGNRAVANFPARQVPDDYAPLRVGSTATGVKGSKALTWLDKLRGEIGASGVIGGDWVIRGDPRWTHYMQASEHLRAQVLQEFTAQVLRRLRTGAGTHLMFHRFHAETGASGAVPNGYALLHGSNSSVGDFELSGVYSTQEAPNGDWIVPAHLSCCFNDIVDPSGNKDRPAPGGADRGPTQQAAR